jgi:prophage endopeptidase
MSRIIGLVLFMITLVGVGWQACSWKMGRDIARKENSELSAAFAESKKLKEKITKLDAQSVKENEDAKREIDNLRRRIAAGDVRMSVPVICPGSRDPKYSGADTGEARAEINPAVALDLIAITDDGDQAIRDLTVCQEILLEIKK